MVTLEDLFPKVLLGSSLLVVRPSHLVPDPQERAAPPPTSILGEDYRRVIDADPRMVLVVGPQNQVTYANPAAAQMLAREAPDLLGCAVEDLVPEGEAEALHEVLGEARVNRRRQLAVGFADARGELQRLRVVAHRFTDRKDRVQVVLRDLGWGPGGQLHDILTGLPNREYLVDRLERSLQRARQSGDYSFAVLVLDIEHFKLLNASLGRSGGDDLLCALADRLQRRMRPGDLVTRLGGDDFAVVIDHVKDALHAARVAERLFRVISDEALQVGERELFVATSIGVAHSARRYRDAEAMLVEAEVAAERAQHQPGSASRVCNADPETQSKALRWFELEAELRRALDQQQFVLHYQPVISLESGAIVSFEALVRWQHPERGLLPPSEFLDIAEETGLILPMGTALMRTACRQLRRWCDRAPSRDGLRVGMNLTSQHFAQPGLLGDVEEALASSGIDARSLTLEITESTMAQSLDAVEEALRALKQLGVSIYVDDFGTGYSSLAYLQRLPVDALKVDRSFVTAMETSTDSAVIVRAVVELGHQLGREVVAEGVETPVQLERLQALGCQLGQGFLFSRPVSGDEAERLLVEPLPWQHRFGQRRFAHDSDGGASESQI